MRPGLPPLQPRPDNEHLRRHLPALQRFVPADGSVIALSTDNPSPLVPEPIIPTDVPMPPPGSPEPAPGTPRPYSDPVPTDVPMPRPQTPEPEPDEPRP